MSENPKGTLVEQLAGQLSDALARCKALETRCSFLEKRLAQEWTITQKAYSSETFDSMRGLVTKMFLELEPTTMLTMEELVEEFHNTYPHLNPANVPRRVFELCEKRFGQVLGRSQENENQPVRYFLMLKEAAQVKLDVPEMVSQ